MAIEPTTATSAAIPLTLVQKADWRAISTSSARSERRSSPAATRSASAISRGYRLVPLGVAAQGVPSAWGRLGGFRIGISSRSRERGQG